MRIPRISTDLKRVSLFVIGVKKAGTTWLYHLLNSHPAVYMCNAKELYYFGNRYPNRLDEYHAHFPLEEPHQYFGEATPEYYLRPAVAEELQEYNPEAKLMVIVRDPIERLRSQFTYHKQLGNLPESLAARALVSPEMRQLRAASHYEKFLPAFQHRFGEGQMIVLSLEDAAAHTATAWSRIESFLGVAQTPAPQMDAATRNPTGSAAFRRLYRAVVRPVKKRSPRLYRAMLRSKAARAIKRWTLSILGPARRGCIPKDVHAQLAEEFAPTYRYLRMMGFEQYG